MSEEIIPSGHPAPICRYPTPYGEPFQGLYKDHRAQHRIIIHRTETLRRENRTCWHTELGRRLAVVHWFYKQPMSYGPKQNAGDIILRNGHLLSCFMPLNITLQELGSQNKRSIFSVFNVQLFNQFYQEWMLPYDQKYQYTSEGLTLYRNNGRWKPYR